MQPVVNLPLPQRALQPSSPDRWTAGRNSRKDMPKAAIEEKGVRALQGRPVQLLLGRGVEAELLPELEGDPAKAEGRSSIVTATMGVHGPHLTAD